MKQERKRVEVQSYVQEEIKGYAARESTFVQQGFVQGAGHASGQETVNVGKMMDQVIGLVSGGAKLMEKSQAMKEGREADVRKVEALQLKEDTAHANSPPGQQESQAYRQAFNASAGNIDSKAAYKNYMSGDTTVQGASEATKTAQEAFTDNLTNFDTSGMNQVQIRDFTNTAITQFDSYIHKSIVGANSNRDAALMKKGIHSVSQQIYQGLSSLQKGSEDLTKMGVTRDVVGTTIKSSVQLKLNGIVSNASASAAAYSAAKSDATANIQTAGALEQSLEYVKGNEELTDLLAGKSREEQMGIIVAHNLAGQGLQTPVDQITSLIAEFDKLQVDGLNYNVTKEGIASKEELLKQRDILIAAASVDHLATKKSLAYSDWLNMTKATRDRWIGVVGTKMAVVSNPDYTSEQVAMGMFNNGAMFRSMTPTQGLKFITPIKVETQQLFEEKFKAYEANLGKEEQLNLIVTLHRLREIKNGGGVIAEEVFKDGVMGQMVKLMEVEPNTEKVIAAVMQYKGLTIKELAQRKSASLDTDPLYISRTVSKMQAKAKLEGFESKEAIDKVVWLALANSDMTSSEYEGDIEKYAQSLSTTLPPSSHILTNTITNEISIPNSWAGLLSKHQDVNQELMSTFINSTYREVLENANLLEKGVGLANGLDVDSIRIRPRGMGKGKFNIVFKSGEGIISRAISEGAVLKHLAATTDRLAAQSIAVSPLLYKATKYASTLWEKSPTGSNTRIYD